MSLFSSALTRSLLSVLLAPGLFAGSEALVPPAAARLIEDAPALRHASLGFEFVDLDSGELLARSHAGNFFAPASNTKLYTTALALVRLGPAYQVQTELRASGPWAPGEPAVPGLTLIGGGDPNLSGRVLPYALHSVDTDPFAALDELASKVAAAGVRQIDGDVVGLATRYPGGLYPDGWTIDDSLYSYGAPVTALALNDNSLSLNVSPTQEGELAAIGLEPATSHYVILNEVLTLASGDTQIQVSRPRSGSEIVLSGTIAKTAAPWREEVALEDPALFAAQSMIDALRAQGITVRGVARSEYAAENETAPSGALLAVHTSEPLWQHVQVINKESQNLHAEMLLREVAHVVRGSGTLAAGLAERDAFLEQIGVTNDNIRLPLDDGCGLARQDLTTPEATVALLRYMWQRPERRVWLQSLPIGGIDGSLEHRFQNIAGAERIHAKTGSYSHVNALSGYLETNRHRSIAFSVMVNDTTGPESEVRRFIDSLCALFLNE